MATEQEVKTEILIKARQHIAKLAEADGETIFAREVLAGCWDHRSDVRAAYVRMAGAEG